MAAALDDFKWTSWLEVKESLVTDFPYPKGVLLAKFLHTQSKSTSCKKPSQISLGKLETRTQPNGDGRNYWNCRSGHIYNILYSECEDRHWTKKLYTAMLNKTFPLKKRGVPTRRRRAQEIEMTNFQYMWSWSHHKSLSPISLHQFSTIGTSYFNNSLSNVSFLLIGWFQSCPVVFRG